MIFEQKKISISISDVFLFQRKKETISTSNKTVYTFGYRLKGSSVFNFENDRNITVTKGELIYIPPYEKYSQYTDSETIIAIHADIANVEEKNVETYKFKDTKKADNLFLALQSCWKNKSPAYYYNSLSVLYKIFALIQTENSFSAVYDKRDEIILLPAVDYIRKNYASSELSVQELARISSVSTVYFRRIFESAYKTSPLKYINEYRIKKAISYLKYGNYSVHNIAKMVGFEDPSYFSRAFKQYTGKTPSEFARTESFGTYDIYKRMN